MAAIQQGPAGVKDKELKSNWPIEEGLTAATQTQEGRVMNLVPEQSLVSERQSRGLN